MPQTWTLADMPDQIGRTAVITGANSGLGYLTAQAIAKRGGSIILACRDKHKAADAASALASGARNKSVRTLDLDLASLTSVRKAGQELHSLTDQVDLLINNAGVMWHPPARTPDGYDLTFATNHLGPFAFTGLLLDLMRRCSDSRIVTVSSIAHRRADFDLTDMEAPRRYRAQVAYGRSKLANLLFALELQRRLHHNGHPMSALAAHPGNARTALNRHMPWLFRGSLWGLARPMTQEAAIGALAIIRAATDPDARGGDYFGPSGRNETTGYPVRVEPAPQAHDLDAARRLWERSEELTGVTYPLSDLADP